MPSCHKSKKCKCENKPVCPPCTTAAPTTTSAPVTCNPCLSVNTTLCEYNRQLDSLFNRIVELTDYLKVVDKSVTLSPAVKELILNNTVENIANINLAIQQLLTNFAEYLANNATTCTENTTTGSPV
jgi:hypothetical protein